MPTAPVSLMPALRRVIAGRAADRSDADLVGAFADDRDPEAFAALVRRHGPMVLGVCRRVVRDPDAADDAFQAVFLVLARRAGDVRPRNRVGAWLYGVAYRTALKARAARARRRTRESQVDAIPEPAARPAADGWDDLKPVLDEELARLPDRLRVPVVLCDLEGRPQRAVAGQLGIAPATLAGRLADARRTLAARLTRRGVALSAAALAALLAERGSAAVVNPQLAAGVVKAAEAVAAGGAAAGLVSANALQLCDGVMRMIFLTKLKAAAATAVVVLAVAGGFGPGLVPAVAQDDGPARAAPAKAGKAADTDAAFLDRICSELRGSKGTPVEHAYFAADADAAKRHKVTGWLLADPAVQAHLGGNKTGELVLDVDVPLDGAARLSRVVTTEQNFDTLLLGLTDTPAPSDPAVRSRVAAHEAAYKASVLRAPATAAGAGDLFYYFDVQDKKDPAPKATARIEVAVEKGAKAPAPGEPVRVRVLTATDDGKGGPKYKVTTLPADPAPKADGKEPTPKATYLYRRLVTGGGEDGGKKGTFLYELLVPADGPKAADGKDPAAAARLWLTQPPTDGDGRGKVVWSTTAPEPDAAFLRRAVTEARGTPPTALEERYFTADPDPRKREKLLDALLSDPAALRRVGDSWKQRMLAPPARPTQVVPYTPKGTPQSGPAGKQSDLLIQPRVEALLLPQGDVRPFLYVQPKGGAGVTDLLVQPKADVVKPKLVTPPVLPSPPAPPAQPTPAVRTVVRLAPAADRWPQLVRELIAAGKTDEQMLESLTLAAAGRLPTDVERRLAQAAVPAGADRAAGWTAVARALAGPSAPTPQPTPVAPPPLPKTKQ